MPCRLLRFVLLAVLCVGALSSSYARSPERVALSFHVVTNVGVGSSVFVVGNHHDIGHWQATNAVKLRWTPGNNWTGQVAIQAGTDLEYKYVTRTDGKTDLCVSNNITFPGGANIATTITAYQDAPYTGKTVLYHTTWTQAFIRYSTDSVTFVDAQLSQVSTGRNASEYRYMADGIAEAGEAVEFVMHDGEGNFDNAPYSGFGLNNYYTKLDAFFLQDGSVYNYWPPASQSVSRIETTFVNSGWAPTIPSRFIRIYLPQGYDINTWKRYPVLYMHDGENIFYDSNPPGFPDTQWDADLTATKEISQGRMRETIIVGIDNEDRFSEYVPPTDGSNADQYANFVIHNVRPTIDVNYRTLNDSNNTMVAGSSLGGLVSTYMGIETNVFGTVGSFSPAYWPASNFVGRIETNDVSGLRIYLDAGDAESDSIWFPTWQVYDLLLEDGYAVNDNMIIKVGCGHAHNEAAWASRLHFFYRFALDIRDEPNRLARDLYPQHMGQVTVQTGRVSFQIDTLKGFKYAVDTIDVLTNATWMNVYTSSVETQAWSTMTLADTNAMNGTSLYYRVRAIPCE